ncbi:MAG: hypothetical protein ACRDRH_24360 [Pseudonocardia sp.]
MKECSPHDPELHGRSDPNIQLGPAARRRAQTAFGDPYRQETAKDGTPKWVAQLAAEFRAFGAPQHELINVGVTCERDLGEGLMPGTPVDWAGRQTASR